MEMRDRLAQVFADLRADGCEVTDGGGSIAACVGPCRCRELASAAIEVMRIPTQAMIAAGAWEDGAGTALLVWRAMVDAALGGV